AVTVAARPLDLNKLVFVAELPGQMHEDLLSVRDLVSQCGSFLTLREEVVSFVHQSAKDFLSVGQGASIFPWGKSRDHGAVARRCRELTVAHVEEGHLRSESARHLHRRGR